MLTGRPLSSLQGAREWDRGLGSTIDIALAPSDRSQLHAVIARRFDAMLAAGLVDEVRALRDRHLLTPQMPSMRSVGYRQAFAYLDGAGDLAALRELGIAATRGLAKRQLTWMRGTSIDPIDCFAADVVETASGRVARALAAPPSAG